MGKMTKANAGASCKPTQKATPKGGKMNMGGYMTKGKPGMNCGGMPHKKRCFGSQWWWHVRHLPPLAAILLCVLKCSTRGKPA